MNIDKQMQTLGEMCDLFSSSIANSPKRLMEMFPDWDVWGSPK